VNTSGRITEKMKRLGCPAANKKEGKKSDSTYTIGTHSEDPISFTLFFAIKKVKTSIKIPKSLGNILVRKNIKKEILSSPISTKIELPISSRTIDIKYIDRIANQKVPLPNLPSLARRSDFKFIIKILT